MLRLQRLRVQRLRQSPRRSPRQSRPRRKRRHRRRLHARKRWKRRRRLRRPRASARGRRGPVGVLLPSKEGRMNDRRYGCWWWWLPMSVINVLDLSLVTAQLMVSVLSPSPRLPPFFAPVVDPSLCLTPRPPSPRLLPRCPDPLVIAPIWAWSVLWYCILAFFHIPPLFTPDSCMSILVVRMCVRVIIVQRFLRLYVCV